MLPSFSRKVLFGLGVAIATASSLSAQNSTPANACSAISTGVLGSFNGFVPSPNDAWHQDISAAPVDPNSKKIITTSGDLANRYLHPDFSSVDGGNAGIPYIVVDSSTVLPVPFTNLMYSDDSDVAAYPIPANLPIEGTPGDCPNDINDRHAIIIDRSSCVIYELFQAASCKSSTPTWSASNGAMWDMLSVEKRPYGYTSVDAAGLSVFEGLVRYDEIVAGGINHALRFTANHTKDNVNNGYFVAPATHAAGSLWGTDNIMGMRIRLRADFDISGFSATNQIILKAMKQYGMILADNGSDMFFQGTPDPRWDDDDLNKLKSVPSSAFDVVKMDAPYDAETAPKGAAPVISTFAPSQSIILKGQSVTLNSSSDGSYSFIDQAGFTRGSVTVTPTATTTYRLTSRNAYGTSTATTTVTVQTAVPPTLAFAPIADKTVTDLPFTVSTTSNSTGAIAYSVVSGPAIIVANVVALTGIGEVTLQASQAAAANYTAGSATISFAVNGVVPVLVINPIPDQVATAASLALTSSSNSQGAITYAVVSGPATVSGNKVILTGTGRVTLIANQAALGNFASTSATVSFAVTAAASGLAINPIVDQTAGSGSVTVSTTSNSPGAITYSILSGTAQVTGSVVTYTAPGVVVVQASQAATSTYAAATAVASFTVKSIVPTLAFNPVPDQVFTPTPFTVTATSNSQGAITYAVAGGPAAIAGNVVTLTGTGRVRLVANQAALGNFAATSATVSFTVSGTVNNLVIAPIPDQTAGSGPVTVSATSSSPGAITYSVVSGPAQVTGNVVTFTAPGVVLLQASQAASGTYAAAIAIASFTVKSIVPTVAFTPIPDQVFTPTPFTVAATSNSQGAITYAVASGPAAIAGNVVTLTGTGRVRLVANQAALGNFAATSATVSFAVSGTVNNLVIAPIPDQTAGSGSVTVSATSSSPGGITYSIVSGPAQVTGNVVSFTTPGVVVVQASQAATSTYAAATAVASFTVKSIAPTLAFNPIPDQVFTPTPFTVAATSNSQGAITYAVAGGPATISGNVVTLNGTGRVTLSASQAALGNFAATSATVSFAVNSAATNLIIAPIAEQMAGGGPVAILATSNSPAAISYSIVSGPARVNGSLITFTAPGLIVVQASQAASTGFTLASATASFTVQALPAGLNINSIATQVNGVGPLALSASSSSNGALTWSVLGGPATLSGSTITPVGAGMVTLQVTQAALGNYAAGVATSNFIVQDFTFGQLPSLSLSTGSQASASVWLGSLSGFTGQVGLSCNVPSEMSGATCTVTNVALKGDSTQVASTLTVTTVHNYYAESGRGPLDNPWTKATALALLLIPFRFSRKRRLPAMVAALIFSIMALGVTGCGTGAPVATAPGTYNLQIVGASGSATHSAVVPVTVH